MDEEQVNQLWRGLEMAFDAQVKLAAIQAECDWPRLTYSGPNRPEEDLAYVEGLTQALDATNWYIIREAQNARND